MGTPLSILIPCHPPKAHFLHSFLTSFALNARAKDIEFYILLTSENDHALFSKIASEFSNILDVKFLFVREYLEHTMKSTKLVHFLDGGCNKGVAVFKKFIGMHWAAKNLKGGVICIDAEAHCLRFNNSNTRTINENYNSGKYIGFNIEEAKNKTFKKINIASELLMHPDTILSEIYTWFFDFPYYGIDDLNLFFKDAEAKFGSEEEFFLALNWFTFEHIVFLCWRVRSGKATLESYNHLKLDSIPELLDRKALMAIQNGCGYTTSWMSARFYYKENSLPPSSTAFLYHMDRI